VIFTFVPASTVFVPEGEVEPPEAEPMVNTAVFTKLALILQSPLTVMVVLFDFLSAIEQFPLPDENVQFSNLYELSGVAEILTLVPTSTFLLVGLIDPPVLAVTVSTPIRIKLALTVQWFSYGTDMDVLFEFLSSIEHFSPPDVTVQFTNL
jgi:hypothetical protein